MATILGLKEKILAIVRRSKASDENLVKAKEEIAALKLRVATVMGEKEASTQECKDAKAVAKEATAEVAALRSKLSGYLQEYDDLSIALEDVNLEATSLLPSVALGAQAYNLVPAVAVAGVPIVQTEQVFEVSQRAFGTVIEPPGTFEAVTGEPGTLLPTGVNPIPQNVTTPAPVEEKTD